jgi:hypothetical protein
VPKGNGEPVSASPDPTRETRHTFVPVRVPFRFRECTREEIAAEVEHRPSWADLWRARQAETRSDQRGRHGRSVVARNTGLSVLYEIQIEIELLT